MFGISWLRLRMGAVKKDELLKKREKIAEAAIAATKAEEA